MFKAMYELTYLVMAAMFGVCVGLAAWFACEVMMDGRHGYPQDEK